VFTDKFVSNLFPEWNKLKSVFGESCNIITLSKDETYELEKIIERIESEDNVFGQRLLIYYLLLQISKLSAGESSSSTQSPSYILDAMSYIEENFSQKISFYELAKSLYIGRTTLMTGFKLHTGSTIGEYLCKCRLRNAIILLEKGQTLESVAEGCGFSDSSSLIKAFKRIYGETPYKYVSNRKQIT
jgi:AraC-like DNA-binding protein